MDRYPDWAALESAPSFGTSERFLDVAGMTVRLQGMSSDQAAWFDARYGVFATDGRNRGAGWGIAVRRADAHGFLQLRGGPEPEMYRLEQEREGSGLRAWSYRFAGWFDVRAGGALALCDGEGRGFESSLENYLRVVYAHLALEGAGFLLHAAGIVRQGRAFLFFGPSGSGKTTTARLSPDARVLSDDLILVLRGDGGGHRAVSIPFRGHFAELPEEQASFPIAGFYRLVKDQEVRLEPLERARAVSEVAGSLPFVTDRPENGLRILEAVGGAVAATPVWRLHFRKEPSFWEVVEAATREREAALETAPPTAR